MKTSIRILNRPIEHKQHDPPRFSPLLLQIAVHSASNIDVCFVVGNYDLLVQVSSEGVMCYD